MKARKVIIGIIVLVLLGALVIACGIGSQNADGKWFQNGNVLTWFNSWGKDKPAPDDESKDSIELMSYSIDAADFEAYGISTQALEAKTITVDFTPANTTNKRIGWTCKWKNSNSDWARNKNIEEYLNFVPAENFGASAILAVMQPFGEPVIVTATSRANPALTSSAQFDYVARYSSFWDDEDIWLDYGDDIDVFANLYTADVYTVVPQSLYADVYIELDGDLVQYINSNGGDCNYSVEFKSVEDVLTWYDVTSAFNDFNEEAIAEYADETGSDIYFSVYVTMQCTYTGVNGEKVYYTFESEQWAYLSSACLAEMATPPTDITVSPGGAF